LAYSVQQSRISTPPLFSQGVREVEAGLGNGIVGKRKEKGLKGRKKGQKREGWRREPLPQTKIYNYTTAYSIPEIRQLRQRQML